MPPSPQREGDFFALSLEATGNQHESPMRSRRHDHTLSSHGLPFQTPPSQPPVPSSKPHSPPARAGLARGVCPTTRLSVLNCRLLPFPQNPVSAGWKEPAVLFLRPAVRARPSKRSVLRVHDIPALADALRSGGMTSLHTSHWEGRRDITPIQKSW